MQASTLRVTSPLEAHLYRRIQRLPLGAFTENAADMIKHHDRVALKAEQFALPQTQRADTSCLGQDQMETRKDRHLYLNKGGTMP